MIFICRISKIYIRRIAGDKARILLKARWNVDIRLFS